MINKNQECAVMSDLLPLYVEHRTGNECNEFIREHLAECEKCRKGLELLEISYEEILREEKGIRGDEVDSRNRVKQERQMKGKSHIKPYVKWKMIMGGYLLLLAGIWMYLIFGLFWGVM